MVLFSYICELFVDTQMLDLHAMRNTCSIPPDGL